MSLCSSCGLQLAGDDSLCIHHHQIFGDNWAAANRAWCGFFHRGEDLPRLPKEERDAEFWQESNTEAVAY